MQFPRVGLQGRGAGVVVAHLVLDYLVPERYPRLSVGDDVVVVISVCMVVAFNWTDCYQFGMILAEGSR